VGEEGSRCVGRSVVDARRIRRRPEDWGRREYRGTQEPEDRLERGRVDDDAGPVRNTAGRLMAASPADWISLVEASAILAASNIQFKPATIGGWARTGKVQSIKLGGRRFVRRGEIKALLAAPRRVRASDLQPGLFEEIRS
jgi:hypothetical protein